MAICNQQMHDYFFSTHRMILYLVDLVKGFSMKMKIYEFWTSGVAIGQGKKEHLPTNDPVIGSYRDPSQRYDSDETVRYY